MLETTRSTSAPTRLIGRLAAEMVLHIVIRTRKAFAPAFDGGSTFDRVSIFLILLRYGGSPFHGVDAHHRALSVSGIAGSIRIPFETARRHVAVLVDHGLVARVAEGVAVAEAVMTQPKIIGLMREFHDVMVAQIDDLAGFGVVMPTTRADVAYSPGETLTASLDTAVALLEHNRALYGTGLAAVVANAVIIANIRHVTYDPVLAQNYARLDTIPPDHLRVPIRASVLARTLGLPYATLAREVRRQSEAGLVTTTPRGLIVRKDQLAQSALTDNNKAALLRAVQVVQRLKMGGFRFDAPTGCYLEGRPAPIMFE